MLHLRTGPEPSPLRRARDWDGVRHRSSATARPGASHTPRARTWLPSNTSQLWLP